jgi:hypothetical protein
MLFIEQDGTFSPLAVWMSGLSISLYIFKTKTFPLYENLSIGNVSSE